MFAKMVHGTILNKLFPNGPVVVTVMLQKHANAESGAASPAVNEFWQVFSVVRQSCFCSTLRQHMRSIVVIAIVFVFTVLLPEACFSQGFPLSRFSPSPDSYSRSTNNTYENWMALRYANSLVPVTNHITDQYQRYDKLPMVGVWIDGKVIKVSKEGYRNSDWICFEIKYGKRVREMKLFGVRAVDSHACKLELQKLRGREIRFFVCYAEHGLCACMIDDLRQIKSVGEHLVKSGAAETDMTDFDKLEQQKMNWAGICHYCNVVHMASVVVLKHLPEFTRARDILVQRSAQNGGRYFTKERVIERGGPTVQLLMEINRMERLVPGARLLASNFSKALDVGKKYQQDLERTAALRKQIQLLHPFLFRPF